MQMRKLTMLLVCAVWLGCGSESKGGPTESPDPGDETAAEAECSAADRPTCCLLCSDILAEPQCTDAGWRCPEDSTDQRDCPSTPSQPACWPPIHPQAVYTYPGCANEDYTCPRLKTVYCALESLRAEHSACEQDSDCVAADLENRCTGYGECAPAMVNAAGRADFEAKANTELARYCTTSPICVESGSCAFPSFVPRCQQGHCVAEPGSSGP